MWPSFLTIFLTCISVSAGKIPLQKKTWPTRVYDGQIEFPTFAQFEKLFKDIDGKYLSPLEPAYANASATINLRVMRTPAVIAYPASAQDIQKIVTFSVQHNVHLCIRSSGHSYIGRSTHGGSVVLNMASMRAVDISLSSTRNPAGEVKVESGASWIEVYTKVNAVDRVVVGGSAHTVAMGGYTQGGGHAPICRRFGLAVDNLLEAEIITAEGKLMTLTAEKTVIQEQDGSTKEISDTSLFWAIRGGGGGTWGVVVSFTYKLHYAPERVRNLALYYPLFSATGSPVYRKSVETALHEISHLSEDWGGYILTSSGPVPNTPYHGLMVAFLNHYGNDSSPSNKEVDTLIAKSNPIYKTDIDYKTFLDYEVTAKDALYTTSYIANTFIQPQTINDTNRKEAFIDFLYDQAGSGIGCTLAMIGGKVMQSHPRPATPVHPAFRSGLYSASCGVGWSYDPLQDAPNIRKALDMAEKLYTHGQGSYFNEPAEDMADWKTRFWADSPTYQRLLDIKKKYDPTNYFWCHNCVASDLGTKYGPPATNALPGHGMTYTPTSDPTVKPTSKKPVLSVPVIG